MRVFKGILRRVDEGVQRHFRGIERFFRGILWMFGKVVQGRFMGIERVIRGMGARIKL